MVELDASRRQGRLCALGRIEIMNKLLDIVRLLPSLDSDLTIYAVKPWTCESTAVVAPEPDDGGVPSEAQRNGAVYFIEVFIATEFLEGWLESEGRKASAREQCERLIQYAVNDA
jgi:hypothetical protein